MGKKSSASSGAVRKLLSMSYYLRKPHRLAFLCLFIVVLLFGFADHHSNVSRSEALSAKVQELEGEREKLEGELAKVQDPQVDGGASDAQTSAKNFRGTSKQLPLILGVTQRSSGGASKTKRSNEGRGEDGNAGAFQARKLLPDEKLNVNDVVKQDAGAGVQDGEGAELKENVLVDSGKSAGSGGNEEGSAARATEEGQGGGSQAKEEKDLEEAKNEQRREAIRWGMIHAWGAYEQYAWGYDELQPQTKRGVNQFGGLGASIVDSLDTLYIMGLKEQFDKARKWVFENMDFNKDYDASVFETTIRVLGGLLSAYDLSGDEGFLQKARELGERLLPAWDTTYGLPWNYLNLGSGRGYNAGWTGGSSILADSGTTTVEMIGLSQRTGDPKYGAKAERVIAHIASIFPEDGLVPLFISPDTGRPTTGKISLGAMGDSFYEYLVKVWVQGGKTSVVQKYRDMWERSMEGMKALVRKTGPQGLTYVAERVNGQLINKMDHLACFIPGMLVLGAEGPKAEEYLSLAKELAKTCYAFYERMPSKLSGEHYLFYEAADGQDLQIGHGYNIGRPETVESLMYLWRKTKDPIYREWGWNIWQAFEKQCRLPSGYTGLRDVSQDPPQKDDMMQSFFLAETLKYLYLLFSPDDVIPLDKWVFNTEAHPVRIIPRNPENPQSGERGGSSAGGREALSSSHQQATFGTVAL